MQLRSTLQNKIEYYFPPRRDFTSLSIKDLLDAREANHIYLSSLKNVYATAIGRYLIHKDDWYATHAPDTPRPKNVQRIKESKNLGNTVVKPWSWPCVLVFVRKWEQDAMLGLNCVPKTLYLADGRVIPVCVVEAQIDEALSDDTVDPFHPSSLLGGGYSCIREHQGEKSRGTFTCLVKRNGTYYALTNSHVAGSEGEKVFAYVRGNYEEVGETTNKQVEHICFNDAFPDWANYKAYITLDAGLVKIDSIQDWTSQVFGIGEIDEVYNATPNSITLDLIGCPVKGFGGFSGPVEGEIKALFFRFQSLGDYDYATDLFIGPRGSKNSKQEIISPFTHPGDSGMMWFYDPEERNSEMKVHTEDVSTSVPVPQGEKARRYIPIAMQWGGTRMILGKNKKSAYALGSFISTIAKQLDFEIVRDWSLGHDEYWGKLGHTAIGWKACNLVPGNLKKLLLANQEYIGTDDKTLKAGSQYKIDKDKFVPLSDVSDYIWVQSRKSTEPMQHFADIDIYDINGGPTLLDNCIKNPKNISSRVWKDYFDGFENVDVGPDPGTLPLRIWQIYESMVDYLKKKDVLRFVAAAGILAHYVGDASQPFHCSYLHHGVPPMIKVKSRKYPIRRTFKNGRTNPEYTKFKKTSSAKIHALYEEQMLEIDTGEMLKLINASLKGSLPKVKIKTGRDCAYEIIKLMARSQKRLSPMKIIKADNHNLKPKQRSTRLWENPTIRKTTALLIADSIKTLAAIWNAAWINGSGNKMGASSLKKLDKNKLKQVYRTEKGFLPSMTLNQMVKQNKYI